MNHANDPAVLFGDECYWRDLVAFTWNIVTLESHNEIREISILYAITPASSSLIAPHRK